MGLLNKIKDLFTDETDDVEPIKKEVIKVEIASPAKIEPELSANVSDSEVINKVEKSPTPVFFSDSDFEDLRDTASRDYSSINKSSYKYKPIKGDKPKEKEEAKIFKPTPIISPIYGILDKNYSKDDISVKQVVPTEKQIISKELSIDLVRKKAFGTLEEELETELFNTSSILFKEEIEEPVEKDLFEELKNKEKISQHNNDDEDIFDNITLDDLANEELSEDTSEEENIIADELEKMFDNNDKLTEGDLFSLIDSMYEKGNDSNE